MSLRDRHQVRIHGDASPPAVVLVHGYGCDQAMWRHLIPYLDDEYRVVIYDQAGSGACDPSAYNPERHATLDGYADDLVAICAEMQLSDVVVIGHSISAMIGVLAHLRAPDLVAGLVMISPSPRFVDELPYVGGFSREQVDDVLRALSTDFDSWARTMAPTFMGRPDRPELAGELAASLRRTDPATAAAFARVTFLSDTRDELSLVQCPTLVVQAGDDPFAPEAVGEYVHDRIAGSAYAKLDATGHFAHVSAPAETARVILGFLRPIRSFIARTRR